MQKGILKDVNEIIDKKLGVWSIGKTSPHYRHKKACDQLHRFPLPNFSADDLLTEVYAQIETNWEKRLRNKSPSPENWRFEPHEYIAEQNKSLEIQLQRAIIKSERNMPLDARKWANHVPTASGLWDHRCDKHRAIDLVHLCQGQNRYDIIEFIELKVDTDGGHPVYAAIEVLLYGILYIFSRRHLEVLEYKPTEQPLLQAKVVHLVVLAPCEYYDGYQFEWLEREITNGLRRFIQESEGYKIDFKFHEFPKDFSIGESIRDGAFIKEALIEVAPVGWAV